jgi:hypothetical protein
MQNLWKCRKLGDNALDNPGPVAGAALAKEPRRRVPGRGFDPLHPAPVAQMGQKNPDRLAHGAGQVGDARVGGDDQIKRGHQGSGFGQIAVAA